MYLHSSHGKNNRIGSVFVAGFVTYKLSVKKKEKKPTLWVRNKVNHRKQETLKRWDVRCL